MTGKIFQKMLTCNLANDRRLGLHEALSSQLEDSDNFQLHRPCSKGNFGDCNFYLTFKFIASTMN